MSKIADYDRLLETCVREFQRVIERVVEREFEAARVLPDDVVEVPWIGGWPHGPPGTYNPHAPRDELAALKQRVIRALCAQRWFEEEAPKWAQPLPLRFDECVALFNGPNAGKRRPGLVGEYGQYLGWMGWKLQHAQRFEEFCAYKISPSA